MNEDLEKIRKEIYKLDYYFEKVKEQFTHVMSLTNTTCYKFGGQSGINVQRETEKELDAKSTKGETKGCGRMDGQFLCGMGYLCPICKANNVEDTKEEQGLSFIGKDPGRRKGCGAYLGGLDLNDYINCGRRDKNGEVKFCDKCEKDTKEEQIENIFMLGKELKVGGDCKICGTKGVCAKMLGHHKLGNCVEDRQHAPGGKD